MQSKRETYKSFLGSVQLLSSLEQYEKEKIADGPGRGMFTLTLRRD